LASSDEGGLATSNEHNLKLINRQEEDIDALEIEGKEEVCTFLCDLKNFGHIMVYPLASVCLSIHTNPEVL
jgi:hypothetical protein